MINLIKQVRVIIYLLIALIVILALALCWRFAPVEAKQLENSYYIINIVAPLFTVIFVALAFSNQQAQLATLKDQMKKNDEKDRDDLVEQRFFLFLKIHRDNVAAMSYNNKVLGKGLFVKAIELFKPNFTNLDKYLDVATNEGQFNRKIEIEEKIEIAYALLFYGTASSESAEILKQILGHFDMVMSDHRMKFHLFVTRLCKALEIKEIGMQSELSNYFRHFFHTVTYIHDLKGLSRDEKRFYIKRLRGQLSNYEMAVLFLNSFSIGRRWRHYDAHNKTVALGIDLIDEYDLIKNLPPGFLSQLNIQDYFPDMPWEGRVHTSNVTKSKSKKTPVLNPEIVRQIQAGFHVPQKA